jgi:hypothetical protein
MIETPKQAPVACALIIPRAVDLAQPAGSPTPPADQNIVQRWILVAELLAECLAPLSLCCGLQYHSAVLCIVRGPARA